MGSIFGEFFGAVFNGFYFVFHKNSGFFDLMPLYFSSIFLVLSCGCFMLIWLNKFSFNFLFGFMQFSSSPLSQQSIAMNFTSGQLDPIIEENEPEEEYIFMDLNRKHFERSASSHL